MVTLKLTQEEAQAIINFCDVAVRANGINSAQSALVIAGKIQQAFNEAAAEAAHTEQTAAFVPD